MVAIWRALVDEDAFAGGVMMVHPDPRQGSPLGRGGPLTREHLPELKSLAALPDKAIDTSDAPELLDWSGAKLGLFYRPVKRQLTLYLNADVVAWFESHATSDGGIA
jgi:hypothetical protein